MSLPRAPATLPDDFAAALGHAVASFGFLEEALKRGIYALSLDSLGDEPGEAELDAWITRMEHVAGDSLGTLIDAFMVACERAGALTLARRRALAAALRLVRDRRNLLCHASWRPAEGGGFRPGFVSSRGAPVPERLHAADIDAIRADALEVAQQVVALAIGTDHDGWSPEVARGAAESDRAAARPAKGGARPTAPQRADADADADADEFWNPLQAEKRHDRPPPRRRRERQPDPRRARRDPQDPG